MIAFRPEQTGSLTDDSDSQPKKNRESNAATMAGGNSLNNNNSNEQDDPAPVCRSWTRFTENVIHTQVPRGVNAISKVAVHRPITCIFLSILLSFTLAAVGYYTNFTVELDDLAIFTPFGVRPLSHAEWIGEVFDTEDSPVLRRIFCMIHADGDNVVSRKNGRYVFDLLQTVTETPGYNYVCTKSDYKNPVTGLNDCEISSVTRFWQNNITRFEEEITSEVEFREAISAANYPDRVPVDTDTIIGNSVRGADGTITQAQSFFVIFYMPQFEGQTYDTESVELAVPDRIFALQDKWDDEGNGLTIDFFTERAYETELRRAIYKDIPLVPLVFIIMTIFTCAVFARRDRVHSRMLLGVLAVVTIVMSLLSSYGLMWIFGVPFTNMTQLVPFVIFGVGLDDTFIIVGSFARTDPSKSIEERLSATMKDIGLSISVTTLTTSVAFGLGSLSNIPAVRWVCLYSVSAIAIDFLYQITLFVAFLVLDERRVQSNRGDLCCCCEVEDELEEAQEPNKIGAPQPNFIDRFMVWYAEQLLRPCVKVLVLLLFTALTVACIYSTTKFRQEFRVTELLPDGSYVTSFFNVFQEYYSRSLPLFVYFRDVDQSDPDIQKQMINYVDELTELDNFDDDVPFCWVKDLPQVLASEQFSYLQNKTFNEQIDILLGYREVQEIYGQHIIRNADGDIVASRCFLFVEDLDLDVVEEQIRLLNLQRDITASQPINQGRSDWAFFTFDNLYLTWEFYDAVVGEWIVSTITGIISVTAIGFLCLPHWSATFFVFPMISILYIDLTGTLQFAGLYINVVTYVALAMSIGLLVDYVVHVLLRYYETPGRTREEKVKEVLRTMGSAVLIGGLSTCLGVVPLAFSTSEIMRTVFVCFISMVTLGIGHGLILLPVVLSILGPINHIPPSGETVLHPLNNIKEDAKAKTVSKTFIVDPPDKIYTLPSFKNPPLTSSRRADPPGMVACEPGANPTDSFDCEEAKEEVCETSLDTDSSSSSSEVKAPAASVASNAHQMPSIVGGAGVESTHLVRGIDPEPNIVSVGAAESLYRTESDEVGVHVDNSSASNGVPEETAILDASNPTEKLCVDVADAFSNCFPSQQQSSPTMKDFKPSM